MERPNLHPQIISDLRKACAILVNETNPPDPDEESDHRDTLRRFEEDRKAKAAAQARAAEAKSQRSAARHEAHAIEKAQKAAAREAEAEARAVLVGKAAALMEGSRKDDTEQTATVIAELDQTGAQEGQVRKQQPRRYSSRRPREDISSSGPGSSRYAHVPKHAAMSFEATTGQRRRSQSYNGTMDTIDSTPTMTSSITQGKQKETERPNLRQINANLGERPKTSAAACVDYDGRSGSSKSTTRSNTEYDNHGRPTSTAVTSVSRTPLDDGRAAYARRISDESSQEEEASAQAKAWLEHKLAIRRAEEQRKSGRAGRQVSRASRRSKKSKMESDSDYDRPPSRAGSIAGSIADSIGNYIRPRQSMDSVRSGWSSSSGLSRSGSRGSSMSMRKWGKGLRKKGSWSSFRSAKPDREEVQDTENQGEVNLNRPLPALPGLDTYKETKTHIGQLMKAGGRGRSRKKDAARYEQPQRQQPPNFYKGPISAPIINESAIDTTLSRFGGALIQRSPSLSKTRQEPPRIAPASQTGHDIPRQASSSHGRTREESPGKTSFSQLHTGSIATATSAKVYKASPMIRGPSYQKEIEAGVYPRPMEVSKGGVMNVKAIEAGGWARPVEIDIYPSKMETSSVSPMEVQTVRSAIESSAPKRSMTVLGLQAQNDAGVWEKKGGLGLKGRMGRMFGGGGGGSGAKA